MRCLLHTFITLGFMLLFSEYASSAPRPKANHEIRVNVDLIDSIFQIPIQTLNAVGNLLKNVHTAKRNFLSVNIHLDHPGDTTGSGYPVSSPGKPSNGYPSAAKPSYPSNKPSTGSYNPTSAKPFGSDSKPSSPPNFGFPDYTPDYNPIIPDSSSSRPVSGAVTPVLTFPQSSETTSGFSSSDTTFPDLASASSAAPPPYRPVERPTNERIPPAPAVQPPYKGGSSYSPPSGGSAVAAVQPLSLDVGGGVNPLDKESTREKNFKDYVARKLAEKNLQDNRISHSF